MSSFRCEKEDIWASPFSTPTLQLLTAAKVDIKVVDRKDQEVKYARHFLSFRHGLSLCHVLIWVWIWRAMVLTGFEESCPLYY